MGYSFLLIFYNFIFYIIALVGLLALPFAKNRQKLKERLCLLKAKKANSKYIWIHGASVGEVLSSKALINQLLSQYGDSFKIVITSHTETSKNIIQSTFGNKVEHRYLPYDCGFLASKFIKQYNPSLVLWLEQDFFPIILSKLNKVKIPVLLLNARFSDTSFKRWKKVKFIISNILKSFSAVYPMSVFNKEKIDFLNDKNNKFIGNLKYSNVVPYAKEHQSENAKYFKDYLVFTALSIHVGEEDIIINLYKKLKAQGINFKIIVIPRHINKINNFLEAFKKQNIETTLYSKISEVSKIAEAPQAQSIVIVDTMGETSDICSFSHLSFIGKSLYMKGGHNLLEPLSVGCPVIFGSNMGNFKDIVDDTLLNKAGLEVATEQDLINTTLYLFEHKNSLESLKSNTSFVQKQGSDIIKKLQGEIDCYLKI